MDNKFSLLEELNETKDKKAEVNDTFPHGIAYQEYTLKVAGNDQKVFIPLKECDAFENTLRQMTNNPNKNELMELMRKHRGLKSNKE